MPQSQVRRKFLGHIFTRHGPGALPRPGLQHTTEQELRSPDNGIRNKKTRSTASRGATRQAPTFQPLLDADCPSMQSILAYSRTLRSPVELLSPSTHHCTLDDATWDIRIADHVASPPNLIGNVANLWVHSFWLSSPVSPPKRLSIPSSCPCA